MLKELEELSSKIQEIHLRMDQLLAKEKPKAKDFDVELAFKEANERIDRHINNKVQFHLNLISQENLEKGLFQSLPSYIPRYPMTKTECTGIDMPTSRNTKVLPPWFWDK